MVGRLPNGGGPQTYRKPPTELTTKEYVKSTKATRHRTAAGPDGITSTMIRARTLSKHVTEIDRRLANFPRLTGYAPKAYCQMFGNLYQKKKNKTNIKLTRPVGFFNIRANNENKRYGRDLMKSAEARGGIPDINYGGRKGLSAGEQATNKTITFDLLRQERRGGSVTIADQQSA